MSVSSRFTAAFESELIKTASYYDSAVTRFRNESRVNVPRLLGGTALGAGIGSLAAHLSPGGIGAGEGAILGAMAGPLPALTESLTKTRMGLHDLTAQHYGIETSSRPKSALKGALIGSLIGPLALLVANKFGLTDTEASQSNLGKASLFGAGVGAERGVMYPLLTGFNKKNVLERKVDQLLPYHMRRIVRRD